MTPSKRAPTPSRPKRGECFPECPSYGKDLPIETRVEERLIRAALRWHVGKVGSLNSLWNAARAVARERAAKGGKK